MRKIYQRAFPLTNSHRLSFASTLSTNQLIRQEVK